MRKSVFAVLFGVIVVALVLSSGGLLYYRHRYLLEKSRGPDRILVEVPVVDAEKDAELSSLREQLAKLLETSSPAVTPVVDPVPVVSRRDGGDQVRRPDRMNLHDLRAADPERYQQIIEHYNAMNERMTSSVEDRLLFFNELDTSGMTVEQLEDHNKLLEKLALMHESIAAARAADDPELIREAMRSQFQNFRDLSSLMEKERDYLIIDAGRMMGFSDEDSRLLRDYVVNAYEITSGRGFFGWGRAGGGRR
ncbi:MAG: hypothetical protein JW808_06350 [Victivallales bacterium]|nr:hypothetical protein [Victivallales bacterium]